MPWAVGRYNMNSYSSDRIAEDLSWTKAEKVDYVPMVYPGFIWGNLKRDPEKFNQIPRMKGALIWK